MTKRVKIFRCPEDEKSLRDLIWNIKMSGDWQVLTVKSSRLYANIYLVRCADKKWFFSLNEEERVAVGYDDKYIDAVSDMEDYKALYDDLLAKNRRAEDLLWRWYSFAQDHVLYIGIQTETHELVAETARLLNVSTKPE
jgi:hypothetical protein